MTGLKFLKTRESPSSESGSLWGSLNSSASFDFRVHFVSLTDLYAI